MSTLPSLLSRSIRAVALPVINGKLVESRASSVAASDATASIVICLWSRRIQSSLRRRAALCEPPFAIIGSRFIRPRAAETARLSRGYDFGLGMQKSCVNLYTSLTEWCQEAGWRYRRGDNSKRLGDKHLFLDSTRPTIGRRPRFSFHAYCLSSTDGNNIPQGRD